MPDIENVDRGDDLLPPDTPSNPEDDKAAIDAAAAAAEADGQAKPDAEDKADPEGEEGAGAEAKAGADKPARGKKTANERIQELIKRGKEREADLQRQIAELQKATSDQKTAENLDQAEAQLLELEEKYAQHLLDGQAKEATAVRKQMRELERAISVAEARQEAAQAKESVKAEIAYDAAVAALEDKYPALNPEAEEFDADLVQDVLDLHTALVGKGAAPATAIQKAVRYVMAERAAIMAEAEDDEPAPDSKAAGLKRTLDTKARNADAAKKQPPSAAKVGADSDALGGGVNSASVLKMSQDDFAKLSEEALAKMRGDFV
jgi:hypothetical protein